jgi:hypothetical protein
MTRSFRPRFAFFNDAGFGVDRAGAACLPILDSEGIAAATVAADSACIGDGQSTLTQGIISAVNETDTDSVPGSGRRPLMWRAQ